MNNNDKKTRWIRIGAAAAMIVLATAAWAATTQQSGNAKDEVFVPTEDISEDFAVSFPVDI